jgi:cob(I)alamin adenosyltransferase
MKVYTKTGDKGKTSLFGGQRVMKDALRIEAYGTIDELNSHLGVIRSLKPVTQLDGILDSLQQELFVLGADLATPRSQKKAKVRRIGSLEVERAEKTIDSLEEYLEPLQAFILPAGSNIASELHVARTVCRRAERCVVRLSRRNDIGPLPLVYLNRVSDLLFVLARYANKLDGVEETKWKSER